MTTQAKVFDLLEKSGTNWSVYKENLQGTQSGNLASMYGITRNDDNSIIGVVGNNYTPYQNADLATHFIEACGDHITKYTGRTFNGGHRILFEGHLDAAVVGHDKVFRRVTFINQHDSSMAIRAGFGNEVFSCGNNFNYIAKGLTRVRHTMNADQKLAIIVEEIQQILDAEEHQIQNFRKMAETLPNKAIQGQVIARLFNIKPGTDEKMLSTRKVNDMQKFREVLDAEYASHGESVWGLFNAVTYYTNHTIQSPSALRDRQDYLLTGEGYHKNARAYEQLVKFINEPKTSVVV